MAQVVSTAELGRELVSALRDVNQQIEQIKDRAHAMDINPHQLRDASGNFTLSPMLSAKAQLLHGITLINQKDK